jgi:hypothetical protein
MLVLKLKVWRWQITSYEILSTLEIVTLVSVTWCVVTPDAIWYEMHKMWKEMKVYTLNILLCPITNSAFVKEIRIHLYFFIYIYVHIHWSTKGHIRDYGIQNSMLMKNYKQLSPAW